MKKTLKILGASLAVLISLSCSLFAFAADYTITAGTPISVTSKGYEDKTVKFVPEVSGTYKLVADSDGPFSIYTDDYIDSDDNYHIEVVNSYEAGTEYEFDVSLGNIWTKNDKIDMSITLVCTHENKTVIPAKGFTCTEPGSGEKIICADCEWVLKDTYTVIARHVDADNDYVCDVCSKEAILIAGSHEDIGYDDDDNEYTYTIDYKFYANGDLYVDGNGRFWLYGIDELEDYYDNLYNPTIKDRDVKFRNVYIGKSITRISSYHGEKFIVDPENKFYSSDAYGVLFSKDGKVLENVPEYWNEVSYDIPYGVETIDNIAFADAQKLESVTIPDTVKHIGWDVFNTKILTCDETVDGLIYIGDILIDDISGWDDDIDERITLEVANVREGTRIMAEEIGWYNEGIVYNIPASVEIICGDLYHDASAYNVAEGNKLYSSIDGVLFSADKTELVKYPAMSERITYDVPAGVKKICNYAIDSWRLRGLTLPDGLEVIEKSAIFAPGVAGITLPGTLKRIEDNGIYIAIRNSYNHFNYNNFGVVVPESVEYLGEEAINGKVAILNPDCFIEKQQSFTSIVGYKDSTAEAYEPAEDSYCQFYSISGLFHKHINFGTIIKAPTCTEDGEVKYACPCGRNRAKTEKIEAYHVILGSVGFEYECEACGEKIDSSVVFPECDCICHDYYSNVIKTIILKVKVFFWKLFRVNQICECGRSLHY